MTDLRIVPCEACGTEGRIILAFWPSRMNEYAEEDRGPCPYCEGTGGEIIAVRPIEFADLDAA